MGWNGRCSAGEYRMGKENEIQTEMIDADSPDFPAEADRLGKAIREGELVAFPTETVYGLGGNGLDGGAVKRIYAAKGRPSDNPVILHVSCMEEIFPLVKEVSPLERKLMEAFWPGPLTLIFKRSEKVPDEAAAGLDTIAIRCPSHPAAQALIRAAGVPIAAPSANISGRPSPTTAQDVLHDMNGRILAVIDGGPCRIGLESTVISCDDGHITIYRPGGTTEEELARFAPVSIDSALITGTGKPKAPGMKYRHYSPAAPLTIYVGDPTEVGKAIAGFGMKTDQTYGFFVSEETATLLPKELPIYVWGRRGDQKTMASRLYTGLLYFNTHTVDQIIGEGTAKTDLGLAIMNRLTKASGYHIIIKGCTD